MNKWNKLQEIIVDAENAKNSKKLIAERMNRYLHTNDKTINYRTL